MTVVYLVQSAAAAAYAIQRGLRAEPLGISTPFGIGTEFLIGWGTAISPGLPLYILLIAALARTWRRGTARKAQVALGSLGALMLSGHLVERVVWTGFAGDPLVAAFALGGGALGLAMAVAARPLELVTLLERHRRRNDTR